MQLTDYTIEDLKFLRDAVVNHKRESISHVRYTSMLLFEVDIEQAIKDKEFERDQTTLPPLSN